MEYLYVLDFVNHRIARISSPIKNDADSNDLLEKHGFKHDDCYIFWSTEQIKLEEL